MTTNAPPPDGENPAQNAITEVRDAIDKATNAIHAITDPTHAFAASTRLADVLRTAEQTVGGIRANAALRAQQFWGLSIAELGKRLGVSKARAAQFVRAARDEPPNGG